MTEQYDGLVHLGFLELEMDGRLLIKSFTKAIREFRQIRRRNSLLSLIIS